MGVNRKPRKAIEPVSHEPVLERILALLDRAGCPKERVEHAPVSGAEEAARVRGTELAAGAKAILNKIDEGARPVRDGGDRRLRSAKIRHALGVRRTRFASREELVEKTGLKPVR